MAAPTWLTSLLKREFFSNCKKHSDKTETNCNLYCLDCESEALCVHCRSPAHDDHQVIQIRKYMYHDVVRVEDIDKILDIIGVQTYVSNGAKVSLLNKRPPRSRQTAARVCETCGKSVSDQFRFCSLGCKVVRAERNGDAGFNIEADKEEEVDSPDQAPTAASARRRRRKGTPQRAPFSELH